MAGLETVTSNLSSYRGRPLLITSFYFTFDHRFYSPPQLVIDFYPQRHFGHVVVAGIFSFPPLGTFGATSYSHAGTEISIRIKKNGRKRLGRHKNPEIRFYFLFSARCNHTAVKNNVRDESATHRGRELDVEHFPQLLSEHVRRHVIPLITTTRRDVAIRQGRVKGGTVGLRRSYKSMRARDGCQGRGTRFSFYEAPFVTYLGSSVPLSLP